MGMLKALENYDISIGAPFVIYKERYAEREVLDYIRSIRTGYTAQSLAEFAKLRKAMAIWDKYERSYTDETLKMIADEMGEETDAVKDILLSGLLNENAVELYRKYADITLNLNGKSIRESVDDIYDNLINKDSNY